jgi:hypothetical protein
MLLCLCVPAAVVAQAAEQSGLCWRARPKPQCGAFVLSDAGVYARLVKATPEERSLAAVLDYGLMLNVTPHDAVGASFFVSIETNAAVGPAVRYRRWFDSQASLDLAVGVPTNGRQTGVFGLVKVNPTDWLGLAVRPKLIRGYDYTNCTTFPCAPVTRTRFGATAGLELSGPPAVAASLAGLLAFVIAIATSGGASD